MPAREHVLEATQTGAPSLDIVIRGAGLSAAVVAVLAAAGLFSVSAYLSAWGIPPTMISLDPLTAAFRAESTIYVFATLTMSVVGLILAYRRWATTLRRRALFFTVTAVLVLLAVGSSIAAGTYGGILINAGAFVLFLGRIGLRRVSLVRLAIAVAILGLVAAYVGGREVGLAYRTRPEQLTPITVTTSNPVARLPAATRVGETWHYDDLYLIFRDTQSLFVGTRNGDAAWSISLTSVVSVAVGE